MVKFKEFWWLCCKTVHLSLDASQKKLEKTRNGVEVTGIGHKRGFKVKWSDEMRTEETVRGLAILVLRRLKKGEGSERDAMASNLMLLIVRTTLKMMRKVRKRKQGTIMKVKTLKKII